MKTDVRSVRTGLRALVSPAPKRILVTAFLAICGGGGAEIEGTEAESQAPKNHGMHIPEPII